MQNQFFTVDYNIKNIIHIINNIKTVNIINITIVNINILIFRQNKFTFFVDKPN